MNAIVDAIKALEDLAEEITEEIAAEAMGFVRLPHFFVQSSSPQYLSRFSSRSKLQAEVTIGPQSISIFRL